MRLAGSGLAKADWGFDIIGEMSIEIKMLGHGCLGIDVMIILKPWLGSDPAAAAVVDWDAIIGDDMLAEIVIADIHCPVYPMSEGNFDTLGIQHLDEMAA
jgi:hypothetical protein